MVEQKLSYNLSESTFLFYDLNGMDIRFFIKCVCQHHCYYLFANNIPRNCAAYCCSRICHPLHLLKINIRKYIHKGTEVCLLRLPKLLQ